MRKKSWSKRALKSTLHNTRLIVNACISTKFKIVDEAEEAALSNGSIDAKRSKAILSLSSRTNSSKLLFPLQDGHSTLSQIPKL
jgi:hypothetical protein